MAEQVDDEVQGMTARPSSDRYSSHSCRRKGLRVKVPGDEKYVDKAQQARDRYEAEWKQKLKHRAAEEKAASKGRDVRGTRGTNSFMEDTGSYTWTCKWRHEPGRAGEGDAVGLCSENAEGFGPYTAPLLGAAGGVSLGLYATGELIYQGKVIGQLTTGSARSLASATKANSGFSTGVDEEGDDGGSNGPTDSLDLLPKCYSGHPFMSEERPIATW